MMAMKEASISEWEYDKIGASILDGFNASEGAYIPHCFNCYTEASITEWYNG
jgi:hypothetical protein